MKRLKNDLFGTPGFPQFRRDDLLDLNIPLTGHIDLLQLRFGKIYIMDYKSNLKRPEKHASQFLLYREAIHNRTSIPKNKIIPAVFNEDGYYELKKEVG